jgi:hypothetical protein
MIHRENKMPSVEGKSDAELIEELREENRLLQDQIRRVLEMNEMLLAEMERMSGTVKDELVASEN